MKVTAVVLAVLMAFSRLYVGVHFPSDVPGGGAGGALLCGWLGLAAVAEVRRLAGPGALRKRGARHDDLYRYLQSRH